MGTAKAEPRALPTAARLSAASTSARLPIKTPTNRPCSSTTAPPVHPGNSGGAVVDEQGRLVGVLIGNLAEVDAADSLAAVGNARGSAFAVPIDDLVPLMNDLARYGGVPRGFLGVSIQQGMVDDPEHPSTPAVMGVAVTDVLNNGPAWKAGIRAGDLVVAVNGQQ